MKSIFVSSTFRDMHFERDVLNRRVTPKINRLLAPYNQSVRLLDLRWGVDTSELSEEEASERVLSVCMNSIDSCKPYIIVLLGDRYGYIPDGSDISVTHMEILRGVINSTGQDHVYIYMREADYGNMSEETRAAFVEQREDSARRLKELKDELIREMPERCRRYTSVWSDEEGRMISPDFESLVLCDLESDLVGEGDLIRYRSELEKQLSENESSLAENLRYAYYDKEQIDSLIEEVRAADHPLGIIGCGGSGKSVYMSLLCSALRNEGVWAEILFCGDNAFSASVRNAAEALLCSMHRVCGLEYDYEGEATLGYDRIIEQISDMRDKVEKKFYFMLDGVEKCDEGMMSFVLWCESFLRERVCIVFSSRMTDALEGRRNSLILRQISYDREDYRRMAECILDKNGKSLNPSLIEAVLDKSHTPLQLQLNVVKLLNLDQSDFDRIQELGGGMDAINSYLREIIEASQDRLDYAILEYLEKLISESENPEFQVFLIGLLTFCEYGVGEEDMHAIFELLEVGWVELDYLDFLERFSFFVRTRDNGRLDISHDVVRDALKVMFRQGDGGFICNLICTHFMNKEPMDAISIRTFFEAAFEGRQLRLMVEFATANSTYLMATNGDMVIAEEIRGCVRRMFFKDYGALMINSIKECRTINEISSLHSMISTSLLSINDYHPDEIIERIARTAIIIPLNVKAMGDTITEMVKMSCIRFMQTHHLSQEKIDSFIAFCNGQKNGAQSEQKPKEKESLETSYEQEIERLRAAERTDKYIHLMKLSNAAKNMSSHTRTAEDAEYIAKELIGMIEGGEIELDGDMHSILLTDLYTTLARSCKARKMWERGIEADKRSLEIYEKIYESNPTAETFSIYRGRVYNVANMIEAQAMDVGDDVELWRNASEWYGRVYELERMAISHGLPERLLVQSASAILSYGKVLIHAGEDEVGLQRIREGATIMVSSAKNNENLHLYAVTCVNLLDCVVQLIKYGRQEAASEIASDVYGYLAVLVNSDDDEINEKIQRIIFAFSNHAIDTIKILHDRGDAAGHNALSDILFRVYEIILPVSPHEIKVNMINTKCNLCASLFLDEENYAETYRHYRELFDLVLSQGLCDADENGKFSNAANARLADGYIRCIICLEKLGRGEELQRLIDEGDMWARFFTDHIEPLHGNLPGVFYKIAVTLLNKKSPSAVIFILKAFTAIKEDGFDVEANKKTVDKILALMEQLTDGVGGEE